MTGDYGGMYANVGDVSVENTDEAVERVCKALKATVERADKRIADGGAGSAETKFTYGR